jgi:hypothetical protein
LYYFLSSAESDLNNDWNFGMVVWMSLNSLSLSWITSSQKFSNLGIAEESCYGDESGSLSSGEEGIGILSGICSIIRYVLRVAKI